MTRRPRSEQPAVDLDLGVGDGAPAGLAGLEGEDAHRGDVHQVATLSRRSAPDSRGAGASRGLVAGDGAVAPALLGRVERLVRAAHQLLAGRRIVRAGRGPDAQREAEVAALVRDAQGAHGLEHALGARAATAPVGVDEDDRELLAAVARDEIHAPRQPPEFGGERLEDPVPEGVAVGVVDPLEVVDVQQQQRERLLVAIAAIEFVGQPLLEPAVVVQPGEAVGHRHALDGLVQHRVGNQGRGLGGDHGENVEVVGVEAPGLLGDQHPDPDEPLRGRAAAARGRSGCAPAPGRRGRSRPCGCSP